MKRGLKRTQSDKVCKRGYGANDPENVDIVNLKEHRHLSFPEIVELLNNRRIERGRNPSLTVCGVTSRYNRNAPLLFASQGRKFVPLSKRRAGDIEEHGNPTGQPAWDDDLDEVLIKCVKEVEAEKWTKVAEKMEDKTGINFGAKSAAKRYSML